MEFSLRTIPFARIILGVGIVIGIIFVVMISPIIYGSIVAGSATLRLQEHLRTAVANAGAQHFTNAESDLASAENDLSNIRAGLRATGSWREAPWIGTRLKALEQVERSATSAISGFHELISVAVAVDPGRPYQNLTREEKLALFVKINTALPRLRLAREKITIAADAWSRVPQSLLFSPIRSAIVPLADRLPELDEAFGQVLNLIEKGAYPDLERLLESARYTQI